MLWGSCFGESASDILAGLNMAGESCGGGKAKFSKLGTDDTRPSSDMSEVGAFGCRL